jgi:tRNA(Ile)-lysidine synthase
MTETRVPDSGSESSSHQVRLAVRQALADLAGDSLVLVACSGGADSLALVRAATAERPRAGAIVIDHGLQVDSREVAAEAALRCKEFGADPVEVVGVFVAQGAKSGGPEAAARTARRAALEEAALRHGAAAILLGHTRDDQAETVLLRLARGSGARSLSAMSTRDGLWRRPLLNIARSVVRDSVADVATWADPHNEDARFARSRVRHDALPALVQALGPEVIDGLARSAMLLRDDADALDQLTDDAWRRCAIIDPGGSSIEFMVEDLRVVPRAVRSRLLRRAAIEVGSSPAALTHAHVACMLAFIEQWHGQGHADLPGRVRADRRYGRLRVFIAEEDRETLRAQ